TRAAAARARTAAGVSAESWMFLPSRSWSTPPDRARRLRHALQLAALVLGRDAVAFHGRREAARRAERQPGQRHDPRRLVDAPAQLVDGLQARLLARHQPQHHLAVLGHRAQGLEAARALVVVLEQEALEAAAAEDAGDGLVAAAGVEHRLVVAAADVERERHAGVAADRRVVHLDARVDEPVGVAAALAVALAQRGVEQRGVLGRVDLYVGAAQAHQLLDLPPRHVDDVRQVGIARGIGAGGLLRIVVRRRLLRADQRDLGRPRRSGPEVHELLAAHAAPPAELVDHDRP